MTTSDDGRAYVKYVDEDGGEVSLPGYLDARPSIVEPGDVLSIREEFADEITSTDRFVSTDAPAAESSPNERLTKAELADKLNAGAGFGDDLVDPEAYTKAELVELADAHDRLFPEPIGETGDNATEGDRQ